MSLQVSYLVQAKDVVTQCGKELTLGDDIRMFQLFVSSDSNDSMVREDCRITDRMALFSPKERFFLSVAYFLPFDLYNQAVIDLLYEQAVHDIRCGRYFHCDQDYCVLVSLVLQKKMQDFMGDNRLLWYEHSLDVMCSEEIQSLLPPHLNTPEKRMVCEAEVLQLYAKLRGYTPQECMLSLNEFMRAWDDYGVTHFYCDVAITLTVHS